MTLKLTSLTFENQSTGKKIELDVPEGFRFEFDKPFKDDTDSANILMGIILGSAYGSAKKLFHSDSE